jgi:hypothetical protein
VSVIVNDVIENQSGREESEVQRFCRANGYTQYAELPGGLYAFVCKMLFNWRLVIGTLDSPCDAYCYDTQEQAVASLTAWDASTEREPSGWKKHPTTGRYREGGDPSKEFVQ